MNAKTFVLDTNILLHDPYAIHKFGPNEVVIPIYVIEEIDNFKKDMSELGRNARQVCRLLDEYRAEGQLAVGVTMSNGGTLRVSMVSKPMPSNLLDKHKADNLILASALEIGEDVVFVTNDANLRIRADAMGLAAEAYEAGSVSSTDAYKGTPTLEVDSAGVDEFYREGSIYIPLDEEDGELFCGEVGPLVDNQYVVLVDEYDPKHSAVARLDTRNSVAEKLQPIPKDGVWGLKPRNKEQHFAFDALLDDSIRLVTLIGKAGTGKTLLSLAAGLMKCVDEHEYAKLLVSRPIAPLGKDIGFLPGDIQEKMLPWMKPIFDNVEYLMGLTRKDKQAGRSYEELFDMGMLEIEPLTYIRGRSIPDQFMIVDEAQNLTRHEIKTILTRVGEDTKIVFTGDPYQIDNPYLDAESNGLSYIAQKFAGQSIAATVHLTKGERSELAELAATLL